MAKRYIRAPFAALMGGIMTFANNKIVMRTIYEKDLVDMGMNKYYTLDLNEQMMRDDLKEMGITKSEEIK